MRAFAHPTNYNSSLAELRRDLLAGFDQRAHGGHRLVEHFALGTVESTQTYTEEQLKIFGDIGALAATSLDKASLFAETEVRARHLAATVEDNGDVYFVPDHGRQLVWAGHHDTIHVECADEAEMAELVRAIGGDGG